VCIVRLRIRFCVPIGSRASFLYHATSASCSLISGFGFATALQCHNSTAGGKCKNSQPRIQSGTGYSLDIATHFAGSTPWLIWHPFSRSWCVLVVARQVQHHVLAITRALSQAKRPVASVRIPLPKISPPPIFPSTSPLFFGFWAAHKENVFN